MRRDINIWTSPACARILASLECAGPADGDMMAARVHLSSTYSRAMLRTLHGHRIIRKVAFRHGANGRPLPIYALGPGVDATPEYQDHATRYRKRRRALAAKYGKAKAYKVLNRKRAGGTRVIVDGREVRSCDVGEAYWMRGRVTGV
jgi:predicted ArsR family transcriptional regulator